MFTDIVASTERLERLGDRRWRAVLAAHHDGVRCLLDRHQGREVNTTGDGFVATFDGPGRAIACATALRDAAERDGLDVRIGLHTGEVERIGDDIGGIAVHLAARICAQAESGEVCVSRTVTDLVAGSGIAFSPRGECELKGISGRWALFGVEATP